MLHPSASNINTVNKVNDVIHASLLYYFPNCHAKDSCDHHIERNQGASGKGATLYRIRLCRGTVERLRHNRFETVEA